jgi:hypothetical protein
MNIINTLAPIPIEELKKFFADPETKFIIDYKESKLQGSKLLTYLSNLDIPSDIKIDNEHDLFDLLKDYFESPFLLNIPTLENAAIDVLLANKNIEPNEKYKEFIEENKDIVSKWSRVLDSLLVYNISIIDSPEIKEHLTNFEVVPEQDLVGINFVNLIKHEHFYLFYDNVNMDEVKYYQSYFNDYMFKGKNLYSFWANENNPLFLLSFGIGAGVEIKDYFVDEDSATQLNSHS